MGGNGGKVAAVTFLPFQPFPPILLVSECNMHETEFSSSRFRVFVATL
jgi:hypothetical protein